MLAISPGAAAQSAPADHGRADRRPRAGDRRAGRGNAGAARARRATSRSSSSSRTSAWRPRSPTPSPSWSTAGSTASSRRRRRSRPIATCSSACSASAAMATRRPKRSTRSESRRCRAGPREASTAGADRGSTLPNPVLPTRWSQDVAAARIEAAARTMSRTPAVAAIDGRPRGRCFPLAARAPQRADVIMAGTLDTKGEELRFIPDIIKAAGLARGWSICRPPAATRAPTCRRRKSRSHHPRVPPASPQAIAARRWPRWRRRSEPGSANSRGCRHDFRRRLRRHGDGDAGDADAACRRAEAHDLDHGGGQCRAPMSDRPTSR